MDDWGTHGSCVLVALRKKFRRRARTMGGTIQFGKRQPGHRAPHSKLVGDDVRSLKYSAPSF